jgi:hypothetical protein
LTVIKTYAVLFTARDDAGNRRQLSGGNFTVARRPPTPPALTLTGNLAFGTQALQSRTRLSLTLKNTGERALTGVVGTLAAPYRVVAGGGNFSLPANQTKLVTVEFNPTTRGTFNRTLSISSNDPLRRLVRMPVSGAVP